MRSPLLVASFSVVAAVSLTAAHPAQAQSLFDDGEGKGSLSIRAGSRIDFNFTESLANLTFTNSTFEKLKVDTNRISLGTKLTPTSPPMSNRKIGNFGRLSLSLRGKPDGDAANLFGSNHATAGAGLTVGYGISRWLSALPSQEDFAITESLSTNITLEHEVLKKGAEVEVALKEQALKEAIEAAEKLPEADRPGAIQPAQQALTKAKNELKSLTKGLTGWKLTPLAALGGDLSEPSPDAWQAKLNAQQKLVDAKKAEVQAAQKELESASSESEVRNAKDKISKLGIEFLSLTRDLAFLQLLPVRRGSLDLLKTQSKILGQKAGHRLRNAINDLENGRTSIGTAEVAALRSPFGPGRRIDFDHLDLRISLDYDRFQVADKDSEGEATQIGDKSSTGVNALLAYSLQFGNEARSDALGEAKNGSPVLIGLAVGYGRFNNKSKLETIGDSDAYLRSDFKEATRWVVNADIAYSPGYLKNRLWFNVFTRNKFLSGDDDIRYGIGTFITEDKNPFKSIGGLAISRTSKAKKDLRVDLIAGYNF